MKRIALPILLALTLAACGTDTQPGPGPDEGTVQVNAALMVPNGGGNLTSVSYTVRTSPGGTTVTTGSISLGAGTSTSTPSVGLFLVAGSYTISMSATTSTSLPCTGTSAAFTVSVGMSTNVSLTLVCGGGTAAPTNGTAIVNATTVRGDQCPVFTSLTAAPLSAKVGDPIALMAAATDADGETLQWSWTTSPANGNFTGGNTNAPTYVCASAGNVTLIANIQDNSTLGGALSCGVGGVVSQSIPVTCLP
jgi:hypothetical protein